MTGILSQQWVDPRLGANLATRQKAATGQIWKPKITNVNGKSDPRNDEFAFWRGFGDTGDILLSEKVTITFRCSMDFRNFPFDSQICCLKFGSCKCSIQTVNYKV